MTKAVKPEQIFSAVKTLYPDMEYMERSAFASIKPCNKDGKRCEMVSIDWGDPDRYPPAPIPELTDEDACQTPRLLVMAKQGDSWVGPYKLLAVTNEINICVKETGVMINWYRVRRCTPDEAAKWEGDK